MSLFTQPLCSQFDSFPDYATQIPTNYADPKKDYIESSLSE